MECCWQPGPLPAGTYNWGGVVPVGQEGSGFYFADFCGDCVKLCDGRTLTAEEVAFYNNCLDLPPCCKSGARLG